MFIVKVTHKTSGSDYWLRGTTWTSEIKRALRYETEEGAIRAFNNAMRFTKPRVFAKTYGEPQYVAAPAIDDSAAVAAYVSAGCGEA